MVSFVYDKLLKPSNLYLILFLTAVGSVLVARISLFPNATTDYNYYLSDWVDHLIIHGFNFQETFSNYNFPYLYLLWFGALFTHDSLLIVKILGLVCDIMLAYAVYSLVRLYKNSFWAKMSFLILLIIPEVLVNSSVWGQSDAIYTAFILFGILFFLKEKPYYGWLFIGLAFSFKIQTIFILPALAIWMIWKRIPLRSSLPGVGIFIVLLIPALIAGRQWKDLLYAYTSQVGANNAGMTVNIPNISVFFGNSVFTGLETALICVSLSLACVMVILGVKYKELLIQDKLALLKMVSISSMVLPFVLPNMLDRYFFVGSIIIVVLALLDYRYIVLAVGMQVITLISYTPYLAETILDTPEIYPVISFPILTLGMLGIIISLFWVHYKRIIREQIS